MAEAIKEARVRHMEQDRLAKAVGEPEQVPII